MMRTLVLLLALLFSACAEVQEEKSPTHIISGNDEFTTQEALDLNAKGIESGTVGDWNQARDYFNEGLSYEPQNITLLSNLGNVEMLSGNSDEALKIYKQCIALDTGYFNSYLNCSRILYDNGDQSGVIDFSDKVVRRSNDPMQLGVAHYMLAKVYLDQSKCDSARVHIQKSLEFITAGKQDATQSELLQEQINNCK
jgi:tetratricopeptide (TPR) repeat protein